GFATDSFRPSFHVVERLVDRDRSVARRELWSLCLGRRLFRRRRIGLIDRRRFIGRRRLGRLGGLRIDRRRIGDKLVPVPKRINRRVRRGRIVIGRRMLARDILLGGNAVRVLVLGRDYVRGRRLVDDMHGGVAMRIDRLGRRISWRAVVGIIGLTDRVTVQR